MENCMTLERKSNLVMPSHYVELDREEMSYVEGGFFIGISIPSSVAVSFYNLVSNSVAKYASGVPGILAIVKMIPQASALLSSVTGKLSAALRFIPLWGKIIAVALLGSLAAATFYAGSKGYGFKIGVEVGWFTMDGICQYI